MKKISIICSLIICLTFILSCNLTAFAADNYEIKEVSSTSLGDNVSVVNPRSSSEPRTGWNLATKGKYSFSGKSYNTGLYTNYYFTGVTAVKIYIKNTGNDILTASFLKKQLINKELHSVDVSSGSSITYKVNKLDSSKRYMIYFIPSGTFSGYIMKA